MLFVIIKKTQEKGNSNEFFKINFRFDIKPYIPYSDAHPDAIGGFTDTAKDFILTVDFPAKLLGQLPEDKQQAAIEVLSHDPRPSYQRNAERIYGLPFSGFDIRFTVNEGTLHVIEVSKL